MPNPKRGGKSRAAYFRTRRRSNPEQFQQYDEKRKPLNRVVKRIGEMLKGKAMPGEIAKAIGLTNDKLRTWLEAQFDRGMTWANYGTLWQVAFRRPLSTFDLADPQQFAQACRYTNLMPLWARDNRLRGTETVMATEAQANRTRRRLEKRRSAPHPDSRLPTPDSRLPNHDAV